MNLDESRIIAFDLETTGTNTNTDQIVQIAYGYYVNGELKDTVTKLFKPTIPINPGAERVHGISMEKLMNEPLFISEAAEIREIFSNADGFMGYNVGFDISIIQAEFERSGVPKLDLNNVSIYDAYLIWTKHEGRSLSHAVERFLGTKMKDAHDALADIQATANVFSKMVDEFSMNDYTGNEFTAIFKGNKVDFGGTFRWEDDEIVLGIGKHKGVRAVDVARKSNYLQWIMKSDFSADAKSIAKKAVLLHHEPQAFKEWILHNFGKPTSK
ncbi:MAG: hypothetical protein CMB64_06315 [Euryarchaeota archaeon]|nr:hypothetical protein [Euryarchaeota archaeon]|tara:strand:- start:287 stop:1096 length:810 start_codon:yes stop_codon:yes gene_type:complete